MQMDKASLAEQGKRFLLLFKEQLPSEYRQAFTVLEKYNNRTVDLPSALSQLEKFASKQPQLKVALSSLLELGNQGQFCHGGPLAQASSGSLQGSLPFSGGGAFAGGQRTRFVTQTDVEAFFERFFKKLNEEDPPVLNALLTKLNDLNVVNVTFRSESELAEVVQEKIGKLNLIEPRKLKSLIDEAIREGKEKRAINGLDEDERENEDEPVEFEEIVKEERKKEPMRESEGKSKGARAREQRRREEIREEASGDDYDTGEKAVSRITSPPVDEHITAEAKLVLDIKMRLGHDFELFSNLFMLYALNVISFSEFVKISIDFLVKIGRKNCEQLEKIVRNREPARLVSNVFNSKNLLEELHGPDNSSYKIVKMKLPNNPCRNSYINKKYMCTSTGTENAGDSEELRKFSKYANEKSLLISEQEMFEFDSILAQLQYAQKVFSNIAQKKVDDSQKATLLIKLSNIEILGQVFDNSAKEILKRVSNDPVLAEFFASELNEKIKFLRQSVSTTLLENWKKTIKLNFYKALDVRIHHLHFLVEKMIKSKHLLKELHSSHKHHGISILNSIDMLMSNPRKHVSHSSIAKDSIHSNPVLSLEVPAGEVLNDTIFFLKIFIKLGDQSNESKEKIIAAVEKLFENYLGDANNIPVNYDIIDGGNVFEQAAEFEHVLFPEKHHYFGKNMDYTQDSSKVTELQSKVKELANEESRREKENNNDGSRHHKIFFGTQSFYLYFRYALMISDRLSFARNLSLSKTKSNQVYNLFKKCLLFHLFNAISEEAYQDLMRILFDLYAGAFLLLEEILKNFTKNPTDELTQFVFGLNKELFRGKTDSKFEEEILFARTCFKQSELNFPAQKNSKFFQANVQVEQVPESPELLKFEFSPEKALLFVHRIPSIFYGEANTLKKFLDNSSQILFFVSNKKAKAPQEENFARKMITHKIPYIFNSKLQKEISVGANFEDVVLSVSKSNEGHLRRKKITKMSGNQIFKEKLELLFKKMREK